MNVDLHVVVRPNANKEWHKELYASIVEDAVNLTLIEGVSPLSKARVAGFAGENEFACYIDDDDYIEPGAISLLVKALKANPFAVAAFGSCYAVSEDGKIIGKIGVHGQPWSLHNTIHLPGYPMHLVLYRRSILEDALPHLMASDWHCDIILTGIAAMLGDFVEVPASKYYWRQHAGQLSKGISEQVKAASDYCKEIAYSCSTCRERMGLPPRQDTKSEEILQTKQLAAPVLFARKCCGNR